MESLQEIEKAQQKEDEIFKEFIRDKVLLNTIKKIDITREVYHDFFKQLSGVTNSSQGEESNPNLYTAHKWVFFTTNYDNAIEEYWVKYRKYRELDLGFTQFPHKRIMNADQFVARYLSNLNGAMQLVKLHGSVNWIKNREGEIEEHPYSSSFESVSSRSGTGDVTSKVSYIIEDIASIS